MAKTDPAPLGEDALILLHELQNGGEIAQSAVCPGSLSFGSHARLYFSNAASSASNGSTDFGAVAALYQIRHGMELWLKCVLRNETIDKFLLLVAGTKLHCAGLYDKLDIINRDKKENKTQLHRALAAMRNVLVDNIVAPRCWAENQGERFADEAVAFLRQTPQLKRSRLADIWHVRVSGHDLLDVYGRAASALHTWKYYSESSPSLMAEGSLPPLERIRAICHLLDHFDHGGDGFRYPDSLDGRWHTDMPNVSMVALGRLAEELEEAMTVFNGIRGEAYALATVSNPAPHDLL